MRAQGKQVHSSVCTTEALPTLTHMALVQLQNVGRLKFLIRYAWGTQTWPIVERSQNCDGIHRRSGITSEHIAELHGNTNLEECRTCAQQYLRDFGCSTHGTQHLTGRKCVCGASLYDTIINFGESLPARPLREAFEHARRADVCIVLGSSLTVTPAADCPRDTHAHGGKLVICNLQRTPLDDLASVRYGRVTLARVTYTPSLQCVCTFGRLHAFSDAIFE
jgi:mono-ADP-ribosyltransferase sirtuin 6